MKRRKELNESVEARYQTGETHKFSSLREASKATGLTEASIKSRCNAGTGSKSKDGITFRWADEHTRRSKLAKKSKAKGGAFELEVAHKLREIGYPNVVSSRSESKTKDDQKIDLIDKDGLLPCNIQCKYTQNLPNYFTIRDACPDKEKPFCLAWKKATNDGSHSEGTVMIIPINYFYDLIKK